VFGADIIAGFPTETEEMFAKCRIVHGHIFPYSPRTGTPAARMPQVDRATVKARAAALRRACGDNRARWLASLVGSRQQVLVESGGTSGHSANFAPVRLPTPPKNAEKSSLRPSPGLRMAR
jgi:threonylcarbamoyladenosine tRNA methylthiotransferase MtaB